MKKIVHVLFVCLLAISLAACSTATKPSSPEVAKNRQKSQRKLISQ